MHAACVQPCGALCGHKVTVPTDARASAAALPGLHTGVASKCRAGWLAASWLGRQVLACPCMLPCPPAACPPARTRMHACMHVRTHKHARAHAPTHAQACTCTHTCISLSASPLSRPSPGLWPAAQEGGATQWHGRRGRCTGDRQPEARRHRPRAPSPVSVQKQDGGWGWDGWGGVGWFDGIGLHHRSAASSLQSTAGLQDCRTAWTWQPRAGLPLTCHPTHPRPPPPPPPPLPSSPSPCKPLRLAPHPHPQAHAPRPANAQATLPTCCGVKS